MTQIRHMLDTDSVSEMWELKDRLKLLGEDITGMYRGRFEEYMRVKSETMLRHLTDRGVDEKAAHHAVSVELHRDLETWKKARPRRGK